MSDSTSKKKIAGKDDFSSKYGGLLRQPAIPQVIFVLVATAFYLLFWSYDVVRRNLDFEYFRLPFTSLAFFGPIFVAGVLMLIPFFQKKWAVNFLASAVLAILYAVASVVFWMVFDVSYNSEAFVAVIFPFVGVPTVITIGAILGLIVLGIKRLARSSDHR